MLRTKSARGRRRTKTGEGERGGGLDSISSSNNSPKKKIQASERISLDKGDDFVTGEVAHVFAKGDALLVTTAWAANPLVARDKVAEGVAVEAEEEFVLGLHGTLDGLRISGQGLAGEGATLHLGPEPDVGRAGHDAVALDWATLVVVVKDAQVDGRAEEEIGDLKVEVISGDHNALVNGDLGGNRVGGEVGNVAAIDVSPVELVTLTRGHGRDITDRTVAKNDGGTETGLGGDAGVVNPVAGELPVIASNGGGMRGKVNQGGNPLSIRGPNGINHLFESHQRGTAKEKGKREREREDVGQVILRK